MEARLVVVNSVWGWLFELTQVTDGRSWSWNRGDGVEGRSGYRVVRAWRLNVGSEQRTVSGTYPKQKGWVTSCLNQLTSSSQREATLTC